jgi:hypothetical protein
MQLQEHHPEPNFARSRVELGTGVDEEMEDEAEKLLVEQLNKAAQASELTPQEEERIVGDLLARWTAAGTGD